MKLPDQCGRLTSSALFQRHSHNGQHNHVGLNNEDERDRRIDWMDRLVGLLAFQPSYFFHSPFDLHGYLGCLGLFSFTYLRSGLNVSRKEAEFDWDGLHLSTFGLYARLPSSSSNYNNEDDLACGE